MIKSSAILEINLKNLIHNYNYFKKIAKDTEVGATIKANAYGIGDKETFSCLYKIGCRNFFVATLKEGVNLRKKFKRGYIYVLNGLENNYTFFFKKYKLIPIINSKEEIIKIIKLKIRFGIHIDTGLNRLGINNKEIIKKLYNNNNIFIVLSHLASADNIYNSYNSFQNNNFNYYKNLFQNKKIIYSLASSMGALLGKNLLFNIREIFKKKFEVL